MGRRQCWEVLQAEVAGSEVEPFTGSWLWPERGHVLGKAGWNVGRAELWLPQRLWPSYYLICAVGRWARGSWGLDDCGQG